MGIETVIAPGDRAGVLGEVLAGGAVGTRVPAGPDAPGPSSRRKLWIAHSIRPRGAVVVDDGARQALVEGGASLLPKGVVGVEAGGPGGFGIGAAVEVRTPGGAPFARGLVSYRSDEIERIKGRRSDEIEGLLGYAYCDEVIHRDDLIVL
jgi:glutamate 5-kinase